LTIWEKLAAPFPPEKISWRVGQTSKDKKKVMMLAYLDARDVQDRLDEAVGPFNWGHSFEEVKGRIVCNLTVFIDSETGDLEGRKRIAVTKADGSDDTDIEGEKGGLSGAFKRAAVHFGIGRYLYHVESPWIPAEDVKPWEIAERSLKKLRAVLPKPRKAPNKPTTASEPKQEKSPPQKAEAAPGKAEAAPAAKSKESVDEFVDRKEKELAAKGREPEPTGAPEGEQPWEKVRRAVPEWSPFDGTYFRGKKGGDPGFLDLAGDHKKRIGPRLYYKVLGGFNLKKASQVAKTNRKQQGKILGYLAAMPDQDTVQGFAANAELILRAAKETKDELLIESICEKMAEVGEKPTKKRCLQILDELEIIMGADSALNGGEDE